MKEIIKESKHCVFYLQDKKGNPYCQCAGSFTGKQCEEKSEFAYIAGGVAGSVIFLILLVLLIWMICVRANRTRKTPEKILSAAADQNGSQVSLKSLTLQLKMRFINTKCCSFSTGQLLLRGTCTIRRKYRTLASFYLRSLL